MINKTDVSESVWKSKKKFLKLTKTLGNLTSTIFAHSSKTPLSFPPAASNSGTKEKWLLRKSSVTEEGVSNGGSLVEENHQNI